MLNSQDGWHVLSGYEVLLKDGAVVQGKGYDQKGRKQLMVPYKIKKSGAVSCVGIGAASFRSAANRGTITMMPY